MEKWPQPHSLICLSKSSGSWSKCYWQPWQGQPPLSPTSPFVSVFSQCHSRKWSTSMEANWLLRSFRLWVYCFKTQREKTSLSMSKMPIQRIISMNHCIISLTSFTPRRTITLNPNILPIFNSTNYISRDRKEKGQNKTNLKHLRGWLATDFLFSRTWSCKLPALVILPGNISLEAMDLYLTRNALQLQAKASTDSTIF